MTLTFGLDFDDTFTAAPTLWATFIAQARAAGHKFVPVTCRRQTLENIELIESQIDHFGCQMVVIFTNLGSKLEEVRRRGIHIDIWIDDDPASLVHGH